MELTIIETNRNKIIKTEMLCDSNYFSYLKVSCVIKKH